MKRKLQVGGVTSGLGLAAWILGGPVAGLLAASAGWLIANKTFPAMEKPWRKLDEVLTEGEHGKVEFKSRLCGKENNTISTKIAEVVASFANAKGGELLLGIADNGEVVGLREDLERVGSPDKLILQLQNYLNSSLSANAQSFYRIRTERHAKGMVVRIEVSPSYREVFCKGQFCVRMGPQTKALSNQEFHEYRKNKEASI